MILIPKVQFSVLVSMVFDYENSSILSYLLAYMFVHPQLQLRITISLMIC